MCGAGPIHAVSQNTESYGVQLSELLAFGGAGVSAGSQSRAPSSWLDELSQHLVASLPVAGKHIHGPSHLSSRAEWVRMKIRMGKLGKKEMETKKKREEPNRRSGCETT
ncbi:hypothetical protein H0G86_003013 [Trichoderma simmonsii]|uniref:Uncharacterized protein n=1 Tax=Trichoderma simmonsii TaxID=1491479 RepID=A0A8G0L4P1_9HYPO|nr:hypothetical protein H0G86_003013 [Trichoderma simmonsii]